MKKTEINDLKVKTVDELRRILSDSRDEIGKLKVEKSTGKLTNTNAIRNIKKNIARTLTFLSMKLVVEASPVEPKTLAKEVHPVK